MTFIGVRMVDPGRTVRRMLLALAAWAPAAQAQQTWALTNARIETVTKGVIERGTLVIRNGLIEAVGATVAVPVDARVMDLGGKTISPGYIDLTSSLGLPAPPAARGGFGGGEGGPNAAPAAPPSGPIGLEASRNVASEVKMTEAEVRAARDVGITAALVAPSRGTFRGLSALVPLRDDTATKWIVKAPVALHMGFQGVPGRYPGTLLGVMAYQRQAFYDAQRLQTILEMQKASTRPVPRPTFDADVEALLPALKGTMPVFFAASNENEIRRAMAIAKEFGLKVSVVGATEAFRALDALAGSRMPILSTDFPDPTSVVGWSYRGAQRITLDDSATRSAAVRKKLEGNAATLNAAGIKFALSSGGRPGSDFMANVRKTIAAGLPANIALQALTIRAAEAASVESQLGSIEVGKIGNVVITDGPPLGESTKVTLVVVDGEVYDVVPAPPAANGRRPNGRPPQSTTHREGSR